MLSPSGHRISNMETLQSAFDLCVKIHEMYGTFTSNKETCAWLTRQVKIIEQTLGQQLARHAVPTELDDALLNLLEARFPPSSLLPTASPWPQHFVLQQIFSHFSHSVLLRRTSPCDRTSAPVKPC